MGPRGKKMMEILLSGKKDIRTPVELEKHYHLTWDMPKATQLIIQRGYVAFKEKFSKSFNVPFDSVFFQLENAYLKTTNDTIHTTLYLTGAEIGALFTLLGLMLDQEFVTDSDAAVIEKCLLNLFESATQA